MRLLLILALAAVGLGCGPPPPLLSSTMGRRGTCS
jgi:hypothetical protein